MSFPEFPGASGRDDLLERVRRRGSRMRAFRRSVLGVSAAAVVALGSVLAYARTGGDQPTRVAASGSTPAFSAATTTTTTAPAPSSSAAPDTTAAPETAPETTATTAPAEVPPCVDSDFEVTVSTDQPSYPQGAIVTVTASGRNISGRACSLRSPQVNPMCRFLPMRIETSSGETGATFPECGFAAPAYSSPPPPDPSQVVPPGESVTSSEQWDQVWKADQRNCPNPSAPSSCPHAPPGQYRAVVSLSGREVASELFQIG